MTGYHHPRFWRIHSGQRWQAVGADNRHLVEAWNTPIHRVELRLCNNQVVIVRRKPGK